MKGFHTIKNGLSRLRSHGQLNRLTKLVLPPFFCILLGAHMLFRLDQQWKSFFSYDLRFHYLPYLVFAKNSILDGSLPLWTPFQAAGRPFFAEMQIGLLYPITWVIFLFEVPAAMKVIQFLNILIGMAGMLIYLRYLKLEWPSIFLGAILFGYTTLSQTMQLCQSSTVCWLPLILWATHRLFDRPGFIACAVIAAFTSLSLLGGHPQHFLYTLIIVGVLVCFLTFSNSRHVGARSGLLHIGLVGLSFLLAMGVASVQLFPMAELSALSVRSSGSELGEAANPFRVLPGALGLDIYLYPSMIKWVSAYLGSSIFLIPFAFASRNHRKLVITYVAAGCLLSLILLDEQILKSNIIGRLPPFSSFRVHFRIMPLLQFIVAMLSAIGLSSFWDKTPFRLQDHESGRLNWFWISAAIFSFGCLYLVFTMSEGPMSYVLIGLAILPLCLLIVLSLSASKISLTTRGASLWIIAFLVVVDFSVHKPFAQTSVSRAVVGENPFLVDSGEWLRKQAQYDRMLLKSPKPNRNTGNIFRVGDLSSYTPFTLTRWSNYVRFMIGPQDFEEILTMGVFYGVLEESLDKLIPHPKFIGLTSLRYVLSYESLVENGSSDMDLEMWKAHRERGTAGHNLFIYENTSALPRCYVANNYLIAQSEDESLHLLDGAANPLHTVILENMSPSFPASENPSNPGRAKINNYRNNEISLSVEADEPSILVLADAFYPGWTAYVNGRKTPIGRANSLFRAVEIPAGDSLIVFRFRPASAYIGAAISCLSVGLIMLGILFERYNRNGRKANS